MRIWKPYLVNVEAILEWPVLNTTEQHHHLPFPVKEEHDHPALSVSVDFDVQSSNHLNETFFEHIHIFNPVLEQRITLETM